MLRTEPELIEKYVKTGKVLLVFHPVINHGLSSLYPHAAADCIGQQSSDLFWVAHNRFFENQGQLYSATRDYFIQEAIAIGADEAAFTACYDNEIGVDRVLFQDELRRERGVYGQPTFTINEQINFGSFGLLEIIEQAVN